MGDDFEYMGVVAGARKQEVILQSDIFVLPSYFEGLPMALLETMANGVVPVVTSVGSIPEIIEHKKNGLLVEKKDVDDLYLNLKDLLNDRDLVCQLSGNAYDVVKERFALDKFIVELELIYETLAG